MSADAMNQKKLPGLLIGLDVLTFAAVTGSLLWVLFFTPREAVMGMSRKSFTFTSPLPGWGCWDSWCHSLPGGAT